MCIEEHFHNGKNKLNLLNTSKKYSLVVINFIIDESLLPKKLCKNSSLKSNKNLEIEYNG